MKRTPKIMGIDAGGTMTDTFLIDEDGHFVVGKAQTTPDDESAGFIASARDEKSGCVFVMGSFNQALSVFALNTVFPDINSSQTAVRKVADDYLTEADDYGYSPDICAYEARVPQKNELEVSI